MVQWNTGGQARDYARVLWFNGIQEDRRGTGLPMHTILIPLARMLCPTYALSMHTILIPLARMLCPTYASVRHSSDPNQ